MPQKVRGLKQKPYILPSTKITLYERNTSTPEKNLSPKRPDQVPTALKVFLSPCKEDSESQFERDTTSVKRKYYASFASTLVDKEMKSPFKDWCHSEVASPSPNKLILSAPRGHPDAATTEEFDRVTSDRSGLLSNDSMSRF
jgi:hypothetical protein